MTATHDVALSSAPPIPSVQWCVVCTDCEQAEVSVAGPFATAALASKWAADDADDNRGAGNLDADETGDFVSIRDENDEPLYEWEVKPLIKPEPVGFYNAMEENEDGTPA